MVKWCKCKSRILCPIALLLLVATLAVCLATSASAAEVTASGTCGDALTWELTDDGVLTISGTGAMSDYTSSTQPWYSNRSSITSVIVEDGVTSIGAYGFYFCTELAFVSLPDSLVTFGKNAFAYCSSLSDITIPSGVTAISSNCFKSTALIGIVLPDGLLSIGQSAFGDCTSLVSVDIPSSVTSLGYEAFSGCNNLSCVYFHSDTPPSFGNSAFFQGVSVRSLKAIYVPNYDAYMATSLGSNYADVIYAYGDEPYIATINWDDYYLGLTPGDDVVTYSYSFSLSGYDSSTSVKYCVLPGNSSIVQYNQLTKATYALDLRDKLVDSLAVSALATFKYSSTKSSSYTSDGVRLDCRYYDDTGYFISSELLYIYKGKMPSGDNTLSSEVDLTPPDGAAYLMAWLYVSHSGQTYTSSSSELVLNFDYEPVPIPVEPEVTDDFGGEVNYLRGQAATPLSVTATVTDGGTLSYQWYYIDSENVDVAVPIDGATGTSYTPDTRSVGSRYYYCIVTNTLGELTASMYSDYAYVTVTRPDLGDGYDIYDYKDYVAGSVVSGSDKTYTITFPMDGIYTELYGGLNGAYSFLDWYTGTNIYCDLPSSAAADDDYIVRLTFFPLGSGSQYNVMKLRNVAQGIPACLVFIFDPECDFYVAESTMTLYWYDDEMNLLGTTEYDLYEEIDTSTGQVALSASFDFNYPGSAVYFTYSIDFPNFEPEENMDFSLQIITADLVMTFSMMEDISGSIGEVGDKVDQVGDKIDQVGDQIGEVGDKIDGTNDRLDDILSGGEAGEELIQGSDKLEEGGVQLGGAVDDLHNTQNALPAVPDNLNDVLVDNTALVAGSNVNGFMPWNDPDYGEFWNLLFTPTIAAVSVALLLYFVFGKARSAA